MEKLLSGFLPLSLLMLGIVTPMGEEPAEGHRLLYQGHDSPRIVTREGKVIYVDPYAGDGYDLPADLIQNRSADSLTYCISSLLRRYAFCAWAGWRACVRAA